MSAPRLKSIDIFRALTMLLMIFVNDLWTLTGVPEWLEHKSAHEDGMGLADVVFPAFLFIVGLSIPHAIRARLNRGDSSWQVFRHIAERTLALLIMGVFMVNLENIDGGRLLFNEYVWQILMALGFFLIWNHYTGPVFGRISPWFPRGLGWMILVFLAATYKAAGDGDYSWMRFHWWGILGLIGWGYLMGALVCLWLGNRPGWIAALCVLTYLCNINEFVTPFPFTVRVVVSASNYASVMTGVLVTVVMINLREKERMNLLIPLLAGISALLFLFGFLTRPAWGISKILATPSWTAICAAISILAYSVLHWVADRLNRTRWADLFGPAGSSTLTCYLVPYFVYALAAIASVHLPEGWRNGAAGIIKSGIFSVLIIQLTGLLGRFGIRLRI